MRFSEHHGKTAKLTPRWKFTDASFETIRELARQLLLDIFHKNHYSGADEF